MLDRALPKHGTSLLTWWCGAVVFCGALLLFQVQPIISKRILPWFGGAPSVWTASMLFFQVLLLGGYLYAHLLVRRGIRRWSLLVHAALLGAAITVPVNPSAAWEPPDSSWPTLRILALLSAHIGLPYFLLASTGPLVQAWFAALFTGRSPYRLYALSNAASLLALFSYPFVFEPLIGTSFQCVVWRASFAVFALLCGALALRVATVAGREAPATGPAKPFRRTGKQAEVGHVWWSWLLLPALASALLLAVTNHLSEDITVAPILWVLPLGIYLLSFILCFDNDRWYHRWWLPLAGAAAAVVVCIVMRASYIDVMLQLVGLPKFAARQAASISAEAIVFMVLLFLVCMVCHGETALRRPDPRHLTSFYLVVASGGALGGLLVSVVCPLIFSSYVEMSLSITAGFLLCVYVAYEQGRQRGYWQTRTRRLAAVAALAVGGCMVLLAQLDALDTHSVVARRNFYGVLRVERLDEGQASENLSLYHGRILHGFQWTDPRRSSTPTAYYDPQSGVGRLLRSMPPDRPRRVGILGLGVGTIAAYGRPGDFFCFYEINPAVQDIAQEQFTFLRHGRGRNVILIGDGRLVMERQAPQHYDVLVLDAFNSDAVPIHLLTAEAFQGYLRHLRNDGIIAAHLTNQHVDLVAVVRRIARHLGLHCVHIGGDGGQHSPQWLLLSRKRGVLDRLDLATASSRSAAPERLGPLWTDDRSDLLQVLK